MSFKCCYSGPHLCELCNETFCCFGAGGVGNYQTTRSGEISCDSCLRYAPKPNICWCCFEKFPSSNKLHKHLKNKNHHINKPKYCKLCCEPFFKKNIYGEVYGFFYDDKIYDHLILCINRKNSWSFSENNSEKLKKFLCETELLEYYQILNNLKNK